MRFTWNEDAWQLHLQLAKRSNSYVSSSGHAFYLYWLKSGQQVLMNGETGDVSQINVTPELVKDPEFMEMFGWVPA